MQVILREGCQTLRSQVMSYKLVLALSIILNFNISFSNEEPKVKYKESKRIDFESLLIEGEKRKAQFSVVTGNLGKSDFGLLKLREDFHDVMLDDIKEVIE